MKPRRMDRALLEGIELEYEVRGEPGSRLC
jgi:hypothetical protein